MQVSSCILVGLSFVTLGGSVAQATTFFGAPTGPAPSSSCGVFVTLNVLTPGLSGTADGMAYSGSLLDVDTGTNLLGLSGCSISLQNQRVMDDVAGNYVLQSNLSGSTLLGVNLTVLGTTTLTVNTFLQSQPGLVSTASYTFPTITILDSVNVAGNSQVVTTSGTDTLVQVITISFGGSAVPLAPVNLDLLSSPNFSSAVTPEVPEPATAVLVLVGLGAMIGLRRRISRRKQPA